MVVYNNSKLKTNMSDDELLLTPSREDISREEVYSDVVKFLTNFRSAKIVVCLIILGDTVSRLLSLIKNALFANYNTDAQVFGIYCLFVAIAYVTFIIIENLITCWHHSKTKKLAIIKREQQQQKKTNSSGIGFTSLRAKLNQQDK